MTTQPPLDNKTQIVKEMLNEMADWPYAEFQIRIKKNLQKMFQRYNTLEEAYRRRLDQLITQHRDYCLSQGNETFIRQHNTFVLHYVNGISTKGIAVKQTISIRTVPKDVNDVLERMLIFLLGFYGVRWDRKTKNK